MDHVFYLVMDGGYHSEMCRMKPDAPLADVEHNFSNLARAAAGRGSVVWSRGELTGGTEFSGGWNMMNVVKVS